MAALEDTDAAFVRHHTFAGCRASILLQQHACCPHCGHDAVPEAEDDDNDDDEGKPLVVDGGREEEAAREEAKTAQDRPAGRSRGGSEGRVHSVLLAAGIHDHLKDEDMKDLPDRFDATSVKAKATWFGALCLSGIGIFINAWIVISTGQIKTIWHAQYPTCWAPDVPQQCPFQIDCCGLFPNTPVQVNGTCAPQTPEVCNADGTYPDQALCDEAVVNAVSYAQFAGIMLGMLTFGRIADVVGRTRAGILTACFMIIGVAVMTFAYSPESEKLFIIFATFFGVFGFGVGGEYPLAAMAAASQHEDAAEDALHDDDERRRARALLDKAKTARRGENIALVFGMQGVGSVMGSVYLLFLVYFSGQLRVDWYVNRNATCARRSNCSTYPILPHSSVLIALSVQ